MEPQPESEPAPNDMYNPTPDPEDLEELEEAIDGEGEENEDGDEGEEEDDPIPLSEARMRSEQGSMESLVRRLATERVSVRVHDIIIKGNSKTKESLIESEIEAVLRDATSFQQLLQAATVANTRLQRLDIFETVSITLEAGPRELPGTANVIVEISEAKNPLTGDIGVYSKPETRSWSLEAALKLKNLLGYGDIWDGSLAYGFGQTSEISAGVSLPRFKGVSTPQSARISLGTQDWLKLSSYKEQALGLSLGLFSVGKHDLSYNLSWRTLTDPSQMASHTVRRQLGHSLFSGLKYTFKHDKRDSAVRPTRGYTFLSTTQIGGLFPDIRSLSFIRQEFDLRYAIPLGVYRSALNLGISGGVVFPWGSRSSYLPERFFIGGNISPVSSLCGPTSVLGFKSRGLGPAEPRRFVRDNPDNTGVDHVGGDLAVTAFADLSFDLPVKVLRDAGIHGHAFACTGSLSRLSENSFRGFSVQKFRDSFRSSVGVGVIVPTKLFRMEVNYCHILKKDESDQAKTGLQFSFSSPH